MQDEAFMSESVSTTAGMSTHGRESRNAAVAAFSEGRRLWTVKQRTPTSRLSANLLTKRRQHRNATLLPADILSPLCASLAYPCRANGGY